MYKLMEQKVEMGPFEGFKVGSGTPWALQREKLFLGLQLVARDFG